MLLIGCIYQKQFRFLFLKQSGTEKVAGACAGIGNHENEDASEI